MFWMLLQVFVNFGIKGRENCEHALGDHRILDFVESEVEFLLPEPSLDAFGWFKIFVLLLDTPKREFFP